MRKLAALTVIGLWLQPALADTSPHRPGNALEQEAARILEQKAESVRCDEQHFVFGVGYIDGSYMERIFYVEGGRDRPALRIEFRSEIPAEVLEDVLSGADLDPLPFVLELTAPRVLHATPAGRGWKLSEEGWETALRFKYTHWFGEIRRESGQWKIEWQGYRRPMLPASVTDHRDAICAMFAGR